VIKVMMVRQVNKVNQVNREMLAIPDHLAILVLWVLLV
jgi:hypothetical protein